MSLVFARFHRDVVAVGGPDAVTYLQGQLSQDVAALGPGEVAQSFVLAPQGKVDGWGRVRRVDPERFEIDVDPGAGAAWEARLRRFLLRTKAEVEVTSDVAGLAVRLVESSSDHAGTTSSATEMTEVAEISGFDGAIAAGWPGLDGVDLLASIDDADIAAAAAALVEAGVGEIDAPGLDAIRIRAGVPRWGAELNDDTIPATVGQWVIDASVSFTKGCYTGQELVARIDSRGGNVPRRLAGFVIAGPAPTPGAEVTVEGAPAGVVTSSAPDGQGSVALAFVPRSVAVPAEGVDALVGGVPALLRPLPLTSG